MNKPFIKIVPKRSIKCMENTDECKPLAKIITTQTFDGAYKKPVCIQMSGRGQRNTQNVCECCGGVLTLRKGIIECAKCDINTAGIRSDLYEIVDNVLRFMPECACAHKKEISGIIAIAVCTAFDEGRKEAANEQN